MKIYYVYFAGNKNVVNGFEIELESNTTFTVMRKHGHQGFSIEALHGGKLPRFYDSPGVLNSSKRVRKLIYDTELKESICDLYENLISFIDAVYRHDNRLIVEKFYDLIWEFRRLNLNLNLTEQTKLDEKIKYLLNNYANNFMFLFDADTKVIQSSEGINGTWEGK